MTCRWTVSVTWVTCGPRCRRCPGSGLHCSDLSITIRQIASLADRPGGPGVPARRTQNGRLQPWVPRRRGCRSPNGAASPRQRDRPRAAPPAAEFPALCRVLRPERKLQGQVRGRFLPGGGRATTRCTGNQGGTAGRGTYSRPHRHSLVQPGGFPLNPLAPYAPVAGGPGQLWLPPNRGCAESRPAASARWK
jgi:hypothetical protein